MEGITMAIIITTIIITTIIGIVGITTIETIIGSITIVILDGITTTCHTGTTTITPPMTGTGMAMQRTELAGMENPDITMTRISTTLQMALRQLNTNMT